MIAGAMDNLLTPPVLFFLLGAVAVAIRSDLTIPEQLGRGIAIYLMVAIGFKGGVELRTSGWSVELILALASGVALSATLAIVAFHILRFGTRLTPVNAAAVAAHYGSVSVVTFATASAFLDERGVAWEGFMVAVLAVMEAPAIVVALLLAGSARPSVVWRDALTNQSVVLLVGSLIVGLATGARGLQEMAPVFDQPFKGVLALFLLEMGLIAVRRVDALRAAGQRVVLFALVMPALAGTSGVALGTLIGLSDGGSTLLGVLAASASYIAAPAAVRLALPDANLSIPLGMSLGITFPFNLLVGIPLYYEVARLL